MPPGDALYDLWETSDFEFDPDVDGDGGTTGGGRAQVRLREPLTIRIPVDELEDGSVCEVRASVDVAATNYRQRESYASAFLRDPMVADGLGFEYTGLTPTNGPVRPLRTPACSAIESC